MTHKRGRDDGHLESILEEDHSEALTKEKMAGNCIRLCTVLIYLFSVSIAAIVLSVYYIFIWEPAEPKDHRGLNVREKTFRH